MRRRAGHLLEVAARQRAGRQRVAPVVAVACDLSQRAGIDAAAAAIAQAERPVEVLINNAGGGRPYKVHVRAPGFPILSAVPRMIEGQLLADMIPTFDTINMIGGEVEQ